MSEEQTYAEGAIGLNGPIGDYAKFCQMLLNKGAFNGRRNMQGPEPLHPEFYERAYRLLDAPATPFTATP